MYVTTEPDRARAYRSPSSERLRHARGPPRSRDAAPITLGSAVKKRSHCTTPPSHAAEKTPVKSARHSRSAQDATGYCANYSMTLSVPETPQASRKDPRRTMGRARHHPHPRVTSLEATPELEGAIPAHIVHGVGSAGHLVTPSSSPTLLVIPYYEQHENSDKSLRPEFITPFPPSE
nr:unnamed protein product [Digitaria exilis]